MWVVFLSNKKPDLRWQRQKKLSNVFKSISPAVSRSFIKMILYSTWVWITEIHSYSNSSRCASRSYKEKITKILLILGYQNISWWKLFSEFFIIMILFYDLCRCSCNRSLNISICTWLINTWKVPDKIPIRSNEC